MKSTLLKFGIVAIVVVFSHCVNEVPSTIHPVLTLKEERLTDSTAQVIMSTTNADNHLLYRIVDDTCMLEVTYYALIGGIYDTYDTIIAIPNDSVAFKKGTFHSIWDVEFSNVEIGDNKKIQVDTLRIFGCVMDETGHEACASLMLLGDTTDVK